jgi:hypothetical protein
MRKGNVTDRKAFGVQMIVEYKHCELPLFKQSQKLKYHCPDISTFNGINFKTYLIKD